MKFILSLFLFLYCSVSYSQDYYQADIIIYWGTSAAITAAVQVKKLGK